MFYGITFFDIILTLLPISAIMAIFFNQQIKKIARLSINQINLLILGLTISILLLIMIKIGIMESVLNIILIIFCLAVFSAGFLVNRKYIYISSIIFLVFAAVLNTLGAEKIAEYMAVLCYLLLVLGVFKDIFYEKIFKVN